MPLSVRSSPHRITVCPKILVASAPKVDIPPLVLDGPFFAGSPAGHKFSGSQSFCFSFHDLTYYSRIFSGRACSLATGLAPGGVVAARSAEPFGLWASAALI